MKFTIKWLKEYLTTEASVQEICATLTNIGLEVESITDQSAKISELIIAHLVEAKQHPNADKLKLCVVSDGQKSYQVVCGAPNAKSDMKVVLALPGTIIPHNGEKLSVGTIRGVESQAMMCSEFELEISQNHDGIINLPADAPIGAKYAQYKGLDDIIIEIKLTPNRGDCLGVYGIARDCAAAGLGTLKPLNIPKVKESLKNPIAWRIDGVNACPFVKGRYFKIQKNGASPKWLQEKLLAVGCKSISTLVDITNYFSLAFGRPLHVFDATKICQSGAKNLVMRHAQDGETLLALDGKIYNCDASMTIISDDNQIHSLAGIMGGMDSGCALDTTEVYLEAAYFHPMDIAHTGRKTGILSDARYRFERGVDPNSVDWGIALASQMILDLCGGEASEEAVAGAKPDNRIAIAFDNKKLASNGGVDNISPEASIAILQKLGCELISQQGDNFTIKTPSFRPDLEGAHCLVEEILRIYGFQNIPALSLPMEKFRQSPAIPENFRKLALARRVLVARGMNEAITWSFTSPFLAQNFACDKNCENITIINPINAEIDTMRPTILGNLMLALGQNIAKNAQAVHLFEIGPVFLGTSLEKDWRDKEITMIGAVRCGKIYDDNFTQIPDASIFTVKKDAEEILQILAPNIQFTITNGDAPNYYHPARSASLKLGAFIIGYFGEIHPQILQKMDIARRVVAFEIFADKLPKPKAIKSRTRPIFTKNHFQAISRDFAFICDAKIPADKLIKCAKKANQQFIKDAKIFDYYEGESIGAGKKSLALRITIQPKDKNLTNDEIHEISHQVVALITAETGAQLRV